MKRNTIISTILILCISSFAWQSCQYDACKARAITCQNEGVCDRGMCQCKLGYEGDSCQTPINEKFASHYDMVRTELFSNNPVPFNDDDTIYMYANTLERNIVNFYSIKDSSIELRGNVRENALTIPEQIIDSITYRGEGSLNGDNLTMMITTRNRTTSVTSQITYVGKKYETF